MSRHIVTLLLVYWLSTPIVSAQAPEEVLLLANARSPESLHIAQEYAQLRGIPAQNIVHLDLPDSVLEPEAEISPEDFMRRIWEPAQAVIRERGLESKILAWIYSVDFPVRVTTDPPMSLMGMTFVRGHVPAPDVISKGAIISPFFAGPDKPDGPAAEGQSLSWFHDILKDRMPLPSMMLGFIGSRGVATEHVLQCLRAGAASDGTRPTGTVFFVTNDDVRSRCRAWQYPAAAAELQSLGVGARITDQFSNDEQSILGFMTGSAWFNPLYGGDAYLPGCMAEHLTSCSAMFHLSDQTKLSAWFFGGATASAGTVTEPMAVWTKFPSARFYVHQARGFSILESFYLSIRCPLQILLVGEPLARPFTDKSAAQLIPPSRPLPSAPPIPVPSDAHTIDLSSVDNGMLTATNEWFLFTPAGELDTMILEAMEPTPRTVAVTISVSPDRWTHLNKQLLGLVFDVQEDGSFKFFGLHGELSAWMFAEGRDKTLDRKVARGAFIRSERSYEIMVRRTDAGLEGIVNGRVVCTWPKDGETIGRCGLLAGGAAGYFRDFKASAASSDPAAP